VVDPDELHLSHLAKVILSMDEELVGFYQDSGGHFRKEQKRFIP
jgi:hypothetical protein